MYEREEDINHGPEVTARGPMEGGPSWNGFVPLHPELLSHLMDGIPPINALKEYDKENKTASVLRKGVQTKMNNDGQALDEKMKGKDRREHKKLLAKKHGLENRISRAEKGSEKEKKLQGKFDAVNQKIIDSYNKQIADPEKKITPEKVLEFDKAGLQYWNVSVSYAQGKKEKTDPGFELARKIMQQYLGDEPKEGDQTLSDPDVDDIKLLLTYFLSGNSLKDDDKDLLLRFMRKYVPGTDERNQVFGYEEGEVDPDKYLTLMTDPELMSDDDRKEHRAGKKKGWRKAMRQERRSARKEARQEFQNKREVIRNSDLSYSGEHKQMQAARKDKRKHRRERKEKSRDTRFENSLYAHYMQLDQLHGEVTGDLTTIKKEHESEGKRATDPEIHGVKDELAPDQAKWAVILLDMLEEFGTTDGSDLEKWDYTATDNKGLDLQQLFQIYPDKYRKAYDYQEAIKKATLQSDKEALYWEAYQHLYGDNPSAAQSVLGNSFTNQADLVNALNAKPELLTELLGGTFNRRYLNGTSLKDPNDTYMDLLGEFGKAAIAVLPEATGVSRFTNYFMERYLQPLITPWTIGIGGGGYLLASSIYAGITGDYTMFGAIDAVPLKFDGTVFSRKFGKSTETLKWFADNEFTKLGMPSTAPGFNNFGHTSTVSVKGGLRYTDTEKEAGELRRQMFVQGMLMIDTVLGNSDDKTNAIGQIDYMRKNIASLTIPEMKELLADPETFMSAATIQSPDNTMWNFRGALNAKYKTKNLTLSGTAVGGAYDAFSGDTKYSFATMGHVAGNWNLSPGAKIKFDADVKAMFMSGDTPKFDAGASVSYVQKVRIHETSFGYYITMGGKVSNHKPNELYIKGGTQFPIGDKYTLGTEVELHYDIKDQWKLWNPFLGATIYLKF